MGVFDDIYGGKFITCKALDKRDHDVTIKEWSIEEFQDGGRQIALSFQEHDWTDRKLGVNKTNANTLAEILGSDDPDQWVGRRITIGPDKTQFQGKMVDCVRVRHKSPEVKQAAAAPASPPPGIGQDNAKKFADKVAEFGGSCENFREMLSEQGQNIPEDPALWPRAIVPAMQKYATDRVKWASDIPFD